MICCCHPTYQGQNWDNVVSHETYARDAKIISIVLAILGLLLIATAYVIYGVSTSSPHACMGFGMIPYLGGIFLNFVGVGLLCGSIVFSLISACAQSRVVTLTPQGH